MSSTGNGAVVDANRSETPLNDMACDRMLKCIWNHVGVNHHDIMVRHVCILAINGWRPTKGRRGSKDLSPEDAFPLPLAIGGVRPQAQTLLWSSGGLVRGVVHNVAQYNEKLSNSMCNSSNVAYSCNCRKQNEYFKAFRIAVPPELFISRTQRHTKNQSYIIQAQGNTAVLCLLHYVGNHDDSCVSSLKEEWWRETEWQERPGKEEE